MTFIQRFGSAINLNLHLHVIVLEGVYLDRTTQGLKPRFLKGEPPTAADIAAVVQTISRRVIRKLRHLGYLEVGLDDTVATGMIRSLTTSPPWPAPWPSPSRSALPVGSGPARRSGALAQALATRGSAPR